MKDSIQYHRVADTSDLILSEGFYSEFEFRPHYHLDYHIGLVVEGVQKQRFKGQSVLLGPGRISVMPPGEIHDGFGHEQSEYCMRTFRIAPALLNEYFDELTGKETDPFFAGAMVENERLAASLVKLYDNIQRVDDLTTLPVEETWFKLCEPLFSHLNAVTPLPVLGGLSLHQLQIVKEYCYENLSCKISLGHLAALCDISRYQFLRRFEQSVGVTPHNWLTQLRLEKACLLLRKSGQKLAHVAVTVGFYDQSHFIHAFRKWYGINPSKY